MTSALVTCLWLQSLQIFGYRHNKKLLKQVF